MRIDGWFIEGYGIFKQREYRGLTGGLTVVLGPNEAGKSTLLAFLRGVLFGFPDRRSRAAVYLPVDGGAHGGRVFLEGPSGPFTVERWAGRRNSLVITDDAGREVSAAEFSRWIGGADETLFRNVFAFSLAELQTLESLQSEEIRDRIYSAHVVGAGRSARQTIAQLNSEMTTLFRPRGSSKLGELAQRLENLNAITMEVRANAARHSELAGECAELRADLDECSRVVEEGQKEKRWFDSLVEVWPAWNERPAGAPSLDGVRAARLELEQSLTALAAEMESKRAVAGQGPAEDEDARLLAIGPAVDAQLAKLPLHRERASGLAEGKQKLEILEAQVARAMERLGPEWTEESVAGFAVTPEWVDQARAWAGSLAGYWREISEYRSNWERSATERERLEQALGEEAQEPAEVDPQVFLRLRAAFAGLEAEKRAVEAIRASRVEPGEAPTAPRWTLLLMAGAVLTLMAVGGWLTATAAAVGFLVILLALIILVVFFVKTTAPGRKVSEESESAVAAAEERIARLETAQAADAAKAGLVEPFTAEDLEAAARSAGERSQQSLRRQLLEQTLSEAREHEQAQKEAYEAAEASFAEQTQGWHTWRKESQLPESLTPENAGAMLADLQYAQNVIEARREAGERVARLTEAEGAWERETAALLGGQSGDLEDLRERVAAARETRDRAEAANRQLKELESRAETARRELERLDQALAQSPVLSPVIAGGEDPSQMRQALSTGNPEGWTRGAAEAEARIADALRRRDDLVGRLRIAERQRTELEESEELAICENQREQARADIERSVREWLVAALAKALVEETLADYTKNRQPAVLREASGCFERITRGAFVRVIQDEGSPSLLMEDRNGKWRRPEELSRGAAEQLFLSLRLGLAAEFGRNGTHLPMVMDDVLVNFDPARAQATAEELVRFAASTSPERQILFFTCHPETARLLQEAAGGARVVELDRPAVMTAG